MKRQYKVERNRPSEPWFSGFVRFRRWYGWSKWECCVRNYEDSPGKVETAIDKYESEQPDSYFYTPKAAS